MSVDGSGPARRAVVRWAWRLFRREWRQQFLVLALVTVAVAAAVTGAAVAINAASKTNGAFGDAGALIRLDNHDPAAARAGVADAKRQFGSVDVIGHTSVAIPGVAEPLDVRAQDPHGAYNHSMLAMRKGHYPTAPNQVALTAGAADLLSASLGDRVELGGERLTVVGEVENPADLDDTFALVPSTGTEDADSLTLLVGIDRSPDGGVPIPNVTGQTNFEVHGAGTNQNAVAASVLIVTTLAMALVCLIAAAGFVAVAQRRQRQLGMLAAIGASERHLRLTMLANGAIVGITAALVGAALGILGWIAIAPAVEAAAAHRIGRFDLPWTEIVECMVLAVVAATVAAWWPARIISRLPVMTALSGRPSSPRAVHRSLLLAVTLLIGGVLAINFAHPTTDHVRPLVLIGGILAVVMGVVFAAPGAIRALSIPARRLPFAPRLALRDLVRYQTRAAAALTAITLVLGIAVTVVVIGQANQHRSDEGNLSDHQIFVRVGDPNAAPSTTVITKAARAQHAAAAAEIAQQLHAPAPFALDLAINPSTTSDPTVHEPISIAAPITNGFRGLGYPYVGTPRLLRHYAINPSAIGATTELLTSRPGNLILLDTSIRPDREPTSHVQRFDLPAFTSGPSALVTQHAMRSHGWEATPAGWLVEAPTALTSAQIRVARTEAAAAGLTVEVRNTQGGLTTLRIAATALGALLALAIVAMTIGLIRSESAGELRTLTATGASPRTRRTLTASTACALALLGVLLGTAGAYIALVAGYHANLDKLSEPPIVHLLLLAIGLPIVAASVGWLLAGREPRTFARQALD